MKTLQERMIGAGLVALVLLAALTILLGNQRPAHAATEPLGSQIVCYVYSSLNAFGSPIPLLTAGDCAATSTPSGAGALEIIKNVTGTSTPSSDFNIHVEVAGSDIAGSPVVASASGVSFIGLSAGNYAVSEESNTAGVDVSDFTASYSGCPAGIATVASGVTTTCTITNAWNSGSIVSSSTESDLSLTKTVDNSSPNTGGDVTYTLTVSNAGPSEAVGVLVTDLLPLGVTYVSDDGSGTYNHVSGTWIVGILADGASATLHITVSVNGGTGGETITNTAAVTSGNTDPNPTNNIGTASIDVNSGGGGGGGGGGPTATSSDVALTKTVDNSTPNVGDMVTYTLTTSDTGADATSVVVQDILPSGITFVSTSSSDTVGVYNPVSGNWTIGALSSTTPATLHIMATVNSGESNGTGITNTASVTSGDTSTDSSNNSASSSLTVTIPSSSGGGGGGGDGGGGGGGPVGGSPTGNGPIVGGYAGGGNGPIPGGEVLGASTQIIPCGQYLTSFIKLGANNDSTQVIRLQAFLDEFEGDSLAINGTYDQPTYLAVKAFQKKYSTSVLGPWGENAPTGYVYLTTRKEVNEIYCNFTEQFPLTSAQQAEINSYRKSEGGTGTQTSGSSATTPVAPIVNSGSGGENTTPSTNSGTVTTESQVGAVGATQSGGGFFSNIGNFFRNMFHR